MSHTAKIMICRKSPKPLLSREPRNPPAVVFLCRAGEALPLFCNELVQQSEQVQAMDLLFLQ